MRRILREEGIRFAVGGRAGGSGRSGGEVTLAVRTPAGEEKLHGSDILVAAGRVPNTAGIGLEQAGVELDARGFIRVNDRLETTAPDVWAVGECAGSPQFTHVSDDDFRVIATISQVAIAARAIGWCRIACSPIPRSPRSG